MITMTDNHRPEIREDEDELLSPRQAVQFLSNLWNQPVTVTSLRMLRLRRRDDPDMPKPDFEDGNIYLWKRGTLRKIKPPKRYGG